MADLKGNIISAAEVHFLLAEAAARGFNVPGTEADHYHAGIAASIRLAVKGYQVLVLEKNNYPGGKLSEITLGNYRFDAGPSLFTMPNLVEELFELASKKTSDFFEYDTHDTCCHYFWEDGTFLKAYSNHQEIETEVENVFPTNGKLFTKKLKKASNNTHIIDLKSIIEQQCLIEKMNLDTYFFLINKF